MFPFPGEQAQLSDCPHLRGSLLSPTLLSFCPLPCQLAPARPGAGSYSAQAGLFLY